MRGSGFARLAIDLYSVNCGRARRRIRELYGQKCGSVASKSGPVETVPTVPVATALGLQAWEYPCSPIVAWACNGKVSGLLFCGLFCTCGMQNLGIIQE